MPNHVDVCIAALLLAGCGARSDLTEPSSTRDAGIDVRVDAVEGGPPCIAADFSTWQTERFRDQGDYERAVAATSNVAWVALKPRGSNVVLANVGIDHTQGIMFHDRIEIANAPVYPVALDVDDSRFVLVTTTGLNWNGDVELWRVDRTNGTIRRAAVGAPPSDPNLTAGAVVGLAGDAIVLAYARLADNRGVIELRDAQLAVVLSAPLSGVTLTAVKTTSAIDVYVGAATRVHAGAWSFAQTSVDPTWQVVGGLSDLLVESGYQVRLTDGEQTWSAAWPDTQISPPAVMRTSSDGSQVGFSLETELSPVVGHVMNGTLLWLAIESAPGAPGFGAGLFPVVEPARLGVFYLGLEIPKPEQPLRYYGLACGD